MKLQIELSCIFFVVTVTRCFAQFSNCDKYYNLEGGGKQVIDSPNFPLFTSGQSCRYTIRVPPTYKVELKCMHLLDLFPSDSCSSNYIVVSDELDPDFTIQNRYCGFNHFKKYSLYNTMTFAYYSTGSSGIFKCYIEAVQAPCECGWRRTSKIVGGVQASLNELPPQIGIQEKATQDILCGGAIINNRYILSAAHCFSANKNPASFRILAGYNDLTKLSETIYNRVYNVQNIIIHPSYSTVTQLNDISMLQTVETMDWSRGVGPACLPSKYASTTFVGSTVEVAGWGSTSFGGPTSNVLLKTYLNVVADTQCSSVFTDYSGTTEICTNTPGKNTCQYDSGGSLYYENARLYTIGITSYDSGCNGAGVNTRVTAYIDWIYNNSDGDFCDM